MPDTNNPKKRQISETTSSPTESPLKHGSTAAVKTDRKVVTESPPLAGGTGGLQTLPTQPSNKVRVVEGVPSGSGRGLDVARSTVAVAVPASSGLTAQTVRIGLKPGDKSSSPSPTKSKSDAKSSDLLSWNNPLPVASKPSALSTASSPTTTYKNNTNGSDGRGFSSFASAASSGFAKFSSAPSPLASLALKTPSTENITPTSTLAPGSPSLKGSISATTTTAPNTSTVTATGSGGSNNISATGSTSSATIKPFTFGSGKGSFGTGKGTFGSGGSSISAFTGSTSVFGVSSSSSSASKKNKEEGGEDENDDNNNAGGEEDDNNAHEGYLEAQKKKLYEIQEVVTGEEGEDLVASLRAKLFYESKTESPPTWKERGLGILKLSKMKDSKHRLVMRSDVVRKVILNTRIQAGMPIHVRNERYIEFYAYEEPTGSEISKFLLRCKNGTAALEFYEKVQKVVPKIERVRVVEEVGVEVAANGAGGKKNGMASTPVVKKIKMDSTSSTSNDARSKAAVGTSSSTEKKSKS